MSWEENPNSLPEPVIASAEAVHASPNHADSGEVGSILDGVEALSAVTPGQIVRGTVLQIRESDVLVDVGVKSEAAIPRSEFLMDDGQMTVAPGDQVDVWIEHYDETAGTVSVSRRKAALRKAWEEIECAFREQTALRGRIVERVKGGLSVDIGVRAFLPGSHADLRPHSNLDALQGQEITCKIIKLNRERNNVVVSRKLALEEEASRRKAELSQRLVEGGEIVGRVKNLTDYGAFVDLGGTDGLLHITDLSWSRVRHPSEVLQVGQELKVKVLKYNPEKERVSLGLKQLSPDPWEPVASLYRVGDRVIGRVVSIADYGAFVELAPGIEGLVHISEMNWGKRLRHPSKIVSLDDRVEVVVLEVNAPQRRISLSLKQTLPDPWQTVSDRYSVGSRVQGRVRNVTDFGGFVEIEEGVEGLIHLSNLSWNRSVKNPSDVLKKGQTVEAVILNLDRANRRLSLGLKQLQPDRWTEFFSKTRVGDIVRGKVSRRAPFGAFVELQEGMEGLCHISEFGEDHAPPEVGSDLDFRVIRLNPTEKKIGLSLKEVTRPPAPPDGNKQKEPEKASTMAEALLSAGVTMSASSPPSAAPAPERETEVLKENPQP